MPGLSGGQKQVGIQAPQWGAMEYPAAQQGVQQAQNIYFPGGQAAQYDPRLNLQVAGFNPTQQQAFGNILGTAGGQAQQLTGAGATQLEQTLSGQYLNPSTNPYLAETYQQAARGLTDEYRLGTAPSTQVDAMRAGAYGGSAYAQEADAQRFGLGQNLANLATQIYGGNYQQERGNQLQALGMVPSQVQGQFIPGQQQLGVGTIEQQQQQLANQIAQQNALQQVQYPYQQLQQYIQALQGLSPGSTQNTYQLSRGIF